MGSPDFSNAGGTVSTLFDPLDLVSGRGSSNALNAQKDAANAANATQLTIFNQQRKDNEPWRQAGQTALSQLQNPGQFLNNFQGDPGYAFRLNEGLKSVNASAAARGNRNSGATLKALTRYGQDYASNEYNNAYNRNFNRLSSLAGFGSNANSQNNQSSQNYGNNVSQNQIGLGNAYAAANVAQSNRISNIAGQAAGAAIAFSDERLKKDITPIDSNDLAEMKKYLKAYAFNYISDDFGTGDWVGVMAQDLEKSKLGKTLVVHDEYGNKQIDLKKVLSMFLATLAEA